MPQAISRRGFLKGAAAAAGVAAGSKIALPSAAQAANGSQLCTVFDLSKCIGCGECVDACREKWQDTVPDPVKDIPKMVPAKVPVQDWSHKKDVDDRLTPYNWLYLEELEFQHQGRDIELNIPRRCMHCVSAPCADLCPFGAGRVEKNGIVHLDPQVCMGGAKCKTVCPWKIPQRQSGMGLYLDLLPNFAGNGVMFKCHRCLPLVADGQKPRCVEVCPEDVQTIGPRAAQLEAAQALARQKAQADGADQARWKDYVYGLNENGGTNTIYVSPVPFQVVAAAIDAQHQSIAAKMPKTKKKRRGNLGRPHMSPADSVMADANNMALAVVLAPIAGAVAGFSKLFTSSKKILDQVGGEK